MITTRQIDVSLDKGRSKLRHMTTKTVDASIRVEPPTGKVDKVPVISASTTNLADIANIADKKRRDEIMTQRKASKNIETDENGLKKLNTQFVFVDIDDLLQGVSRRELK